MKNNLFLALGLCFSLSLFGQLKTYDLSKYKLADYHFQALNTNFGFNGATNSQVESFSIGQKRSFHFFKPEIGINHFQIKNTRKVQVFNSLSFDMTYYHGTNDFSDNRLWRLNAAIDHFYESKFYNKKEQFLAIGADYYLYSNSGRILPNAAASEKFGMFTSRINVPFSAGIGRVENVTDAWQSIRILETLNGLGYLKSEPGDEVIKGFADFINRRQQLRYFDFRLKRIEDLEELDAFLEDTDLLTERDATYYATLYDMWLYGINAARQAGSSFSVGFAPTFYRTSVREPNGNYEPDFRYAGLNSFLKYEYHKPINLNLQLDIDVSFNVDIEYDLEKVNPTGLLLYRPEINFKLGYYPTSRTELTTDLRSTYVGSHDNYELNSYGQGLLIRSETRLYYYLSPQTRLSGYFYLGYLSAERFGFCGNFYNGNNVFLNQPAVDDSCNYSNFGLRLSHSFL